MQARMFNPAGDSRVTPGSCTWRSGAGCGSRWGGPPAAVRGCAQRALSGVLPHRSTTLQGRLRCRGRRRRIPSRKCVSASQNRSRRCSVLARSPRSSTPRGALRPRVPLPREESSPSAARRRPLRCAGWCERRVAPLLLQSGSLAERVDEHSQPTWRRRTALTAGRGERSNADQEREDAQYRREGLLHYLHQLPVRILADDLPVPELPMITSAHRHSAALWRLPVSSRSETAKFPLAQWRLSL